MPTKPSQKTASPAISTTMLDGLHGIDNYLSVIHGSLEMLLLSDLPDYVMTDLVKVYQAEQEASQIVHSLRIYCHKYR